MKDLQPTIIIRHYKENLKKCSLRGLEGRDDFIFCKYPVKQMPQLEGYVTLSVDATEILSPKDAKRGLLLLDATWRYAKKMQQTLQLPKTVVHRALPRNLQTAYPRKQSEPQGLASIEALYAAFLLTNRDPQGLLDNYYWKEQFLEKNALLSII